MGPNQTKSQFRENIFSRHSSDAPGEKHGARTIPPVFSLASNHAFELAKMGKRFTALGAVTLCLFVLVAAASAQQETVTDNACFCSDSCGYGFNVFRGKWCHTKNGCGTNGEVGLLSSAKLSANNSSPSSSLPPSCAGQLR